MTVSREEVRGQPLGLRLALILSAAVLFLALRRQDANRTAALEIDLEKLLGAVRHVLPPATA